MQEKGPAWGGRCVFLLACRGAGGSLVSVPVVDQENGLVLGCFQSIAEVPWSKELKPRGAEVP